MGTREFEALGPMLRAVATGPKRCAGDVLVFGPRVEVADFYGRPVEAVAPVDGVEWGALLAGPEVVGERLRGRGCDGAAARMVEASAAARMAGSHGSTVAVEWRGRDQGPDVHLLVERPTETSPAPPVPGPRLFPSEAELVAACAEGAPETSVILVASSAELRRVLGADVAPVGFVVGRDVGAAVAPPGVFLVTLSSAADFAALSAAQLRHGAAPLVLWGAPGSRVVSRVEDYAAALDADTTARAWATQASHAAQRRAVGAGRLIGESEQRAAVAWAESLTPPGHGKSDVATMVWGDGFASCVVAHPELPHVGSLARPWAFEGVVRELLRRRAARAPDAARVAFFVGSILCRVWTATGGSGGGPALVRLDDGERRADVLRADESGAEGDE